MRRTVLFLGLLIIPAFGLNILVFSPTIATSHIKFLAKLADILTDAGNNVTFLVTVGEETRKTNLFIKSTKDVYIVERDEEMKRVSPPLDQNMGGLWHVDPRTEKIAETHSMFMRLMENTCANFLRNSEVFDEMKKRSFDVAITEPLLFCDMGFFKKLGIEKTILASSVTAFDFTFPHIGEPTDYSYFPALASDMKEKMSIYERYENYRLAREFTIPYEGVFDEQTRLYRKYLGQDLPDWRQLMSEASLYFTNSNPYIDFPRPVIQKTVAIGGVSVDMESIKSKKIPKEFDELLNLRNKTMLISFGSIVRSVDMPIDYRQNLLKTIQSMPDVTFIWKYETDDIEWAADTPNLHFSKWVPQPPLLLDERLTAFLTHGGLGSVNELAFCGKPALMVPIFADQMKNANMLERHGGVIVLNKKQLGDQELLESSIYKILHDESYKLNAKRISEMLANQPLNPSELVVKYTEFVGKYGPFPRMDPYGRHLNFIQRTMLDVYFLILISYILVGVGSLLLLRFLYKRIGFRKVKTAK